MPRMNFKYRSTICVLVYCCILILWAFCRKTQIGETLYHQTKGFCQNWRGVHLAYCPINEVLLPTTLFHDPTFSPIMESFRKSHNKNLKDNQYIPTFLLIKQRPKNSNFWKNELQDITKNRCPLPCHFTEDIRQASTVDAIVFYISAMKNREHFHKLIPIRNLSQPWIMVTLESPLRANAFHHTKYSEFDEIFNRTATYRQDSDIKLPYGAIFSYNDSKYLPPQWAMPPYNQIKETSKLVATFISNCNAESGRLEYIKELQNYIVVDIYGACGKFKCGGSMYVEHGYDVHTNKCLKKVGSSYLFYLAFENSICEDYITEKVYNILHYPIVPVVMGGANYSKMLPPGSFINALDFSPKDLAIYLTSLQNNRNLYKKYLTWRQYYQASTWGGVSPFCDVCSKLHNPDFYKTSIIENFDQWFNQSSKCHRHWEMYMTSSENRIE